MIRVFNAFIVLNRFLIAKRTGIAHFSGMASGAEDLIPTRATLLNRLRDWQNHSSWQEFFDIYWGLIFGLATKHGLSRSEAEDVVQEVMADTARQMPDFKYDPAQGSFKAWLLNLTRWRILDHYRKRQLSEALIEPVYEPTSAKAKLDEDTHLIQPDLEKIWDLEWEKHLLEAATAKARRKLDPKQYQVFDLVVNRDWPPERVAQMLNLSLSLVYVSKHRVSEMIKTEFERLQKEII